MSYNFLDKTGLTYFWGKIKDYISKITRNDLAVISNKEYSGIYGSANDQAGASFYFATVRPNNFYQMWRIKFRVYSNVPNQNEYIQYSEVEYYGNKSDIGYVIFNRIANTSGRCYYYNNLCRLSLTGYNAGYSHILGMGLRSSNNPTSSSYPRYFKIELLETENCTFTFYDTMKKIANISEYNTTNYAAITEYDGSNNGLRETGDDTNIWQLRHNAGNYVVSTALYRYMLCLQKNETTLIPMNAVNNSTATTKTLTTDIFNPFGQIVYYNNTNTVNANASVGASALFEQSQLDLRYSFNTGTTLTSHKDVYMVAVPQTNGMAKLHSTPITQTLPTSENGLIYILLGRAYSNYQIELYPMHPIYEYKNGSLGLYSKYEYYARNLTPVSICGSDSANTAGWYKIASSVMSSWGNTNILYFVKDGYASGQTGILDLEMRSDNTSISCWQVKWLTRNVSLPADSVRIVIDGMTWTMYFKRLTSQYGRVYFTEISHRSIGGSKPSYNVTYYDSSAPEQEAPSTNIISSDGGVALRATGDKNGNDITTTYQPKLTPGSNITITNNTIAATDTTYSVATTSVAGLMSPGDKTKADNIDRLLTNENLNNLLSTGTYYAGGGNTVSNKPTGVDAFGLKVFRTASGFWTQELIEGNTTPGARWTRQQSNNTWSSWTKMLWTDTTYTSKAAASGGTDVSLVTTGEKYTWNSKTSNTGTVTSVAVKMNNTTKGTVTTSGTIDLGTVITSHQDISGKQDKLTTQTAYTSKGSATKVPQITTNTLGQVTGITEVTISQPTVNNGTLTIQKNGTNVQTFSANQSGNATANITVPTKVSDLNNDSNFTSKTYVDNAVAANRGAENPIATILAYAGSEAPDGYLLCRGQAVSRTTYSLLFNAIGTQYGSGDGSTTFNIPDLQGKVIAGLDIVDEDFNVLGKTGGSKTVQLTKNQLPKINGSFTMHGAGSSTPVSNVSGDFTSDYNNTKYKNGGTEASGAGSKGNVKLVIGNDEAHENKQPYNTLNYIIKAYSGTDVPVPVESNSVKNSYDDSIANVYSTNYINTKVRGKKLWTNPNPNSSFAAQTITFNETNDYDFYKIKIKYGIDESYAYNWQDVEVGDIFNLLLMWSYTPGMADPSIKGHIGTGFRPECSCNHNSITFTNAVYYTSMDSTKSVNDTSHCIPLEIYGYYI